MIEHLYKYREILPSNNLTLDRNIRALFQCYLMLNSRKNFEDKMDSKINFTTEFEKEDIVWLLERCPSSHIEELKSCFNGMSLNHKGRKKIKLLIYKFNELVDRYPIYCMSSSGVSGHMWNKYAGKSSGFCIEFNAACIRATPVQYKGKIAEMNILSLFSKLFNIYVPDASEEMLGKKIHELLHIKLEQWQLEDEHRFIRSGLLCSVNGREKYPYSRTDVSSIIFGSKMRQKHKEFIIKNIPFQVPFKQAVEDKESFVIRLEDYSAREVQSNYAVQP